MKWFDRAWGLTLAALTSILGLLLTAVLLLISIFVVFILAKSLYNVATNTNFTPSSQLVTGIGLVVVCIVALLLLALFGIAVARVFTNIARKEPVALLPDQRLLQGGPTRVVDSTRANTDEP